MAVVVDTGLGRLEGLRGAGGVRTFRGIPFTRPPVGERRFRAPEPPQPWTGARDATRPGPAAPQPPMQIPLPGFDVGEQSEDCLTLNVYAPADAGSGRPVMVWIHGGAFVIGSGSQWIYDATRLVERGDVVVVTIHYRLGALGFLHLGDVEGAAPNPGLLDQIAALRWVRDHVEAFGGDPGNVTVFGESAGGMSVGTLLGCPAARGLFHKAIAQSGACHAVNDRESAGAITSALFAELGLPAGSTSALREVPLERLIDAQRQVSLRGMLGAGSQVLPFAPVVDGELLPRPPIEDVAEGGARDVAVLAGTTRDEWSLFGFMDPQLRRLDEEGLLARVAKRLPHADARAVVAGYQASRPGADWGVIHTAFETDRVFRVPALRLAEAQVAQGADAYVYRFDWPAAFGGGLLGACHGVDVPFVFDMLDAPGADRFVGSGPEAERLRDRVVAAWTSFARSGRPDLGAEPAWPRYEPDRRATLAFAADCSVLEDPDGAERRLWEGLM